MSQILNAIYDLLCYCTEDAVAHGFMKDVPMSIRTKMNELANELGEYLDENE